MQDPVDVTSLLELRQLQRPGAPDVVGRILDRFFEESATRVDDLRRAADAGDAQTIERAAHAIKGISGTVGAHEVSDLATRLEQIGREGRIQDASPLVRELDSALTRARPIFERLLQTDVHDPS